MSKNIQALPETGCLQAPWYSVIGIRLQPGFVVQDRCNELVFRGLKLPGTYVGRMFFNELGSLYKGVAYKGVAGIASWVDIRYGIRGDGYQGFMSEFFDE